MVNLLIKPVGSPSVAEAARVGQNFRQGQQENKLRGMQIKNVLADRKYTEKKRGWEDEDRAYLKSVRDFNKSKRPGERLKALNTALTEANKFSTLANHDQMNAQISSTFGIDAGIDTAEDINNMAIQAGRDPEEFYQTIYKPDKMRTWAQKYEATATELSKEKEFGRKKELEGIKAGGKSPANAMAKYIKDNPNATSEDLIDFTSKLAAAKETGGGKDKNPTPQAALKRISGIQKAIATLEKTDTITQLLAKDNPELAKYIGQTLDPEKKAALMDAWNNELNYLEQFSGTTRKQKGSNKSWRDYL